MIETFQIKAPREGLLDITDHVAAVVTKAGLVEGLCTVFIRHTSASLLIQENADPSAKRDLELWLNRLVPAGDPLYTHNFEGGDDMPAHIKSALTASSISIPVINSQLALGTWQGIYLWEHRKGRKSRTVIVHVGA